MASRNLKGRRDTSAASAARYFALRARADDRRPEQAHMTLQQIRIGDEYRYRDIDTGREYTAREVRALTGHCISTRYVDEQPRSR